jgi:hypothetical protein
MFVEYCEEMYDLSSLPFGFAHATCRCHKPVWLTVTKYSNGLSSPFRLPPNHVGWERLSSPPWGNDADDDGNSKGSAGSIVVTDALQFSFVSFGSFAGRNRMLFRGGGCC